MAPIRFSIFSTASTMYQDAFHPVLWPRVKVIALLKIFGGQGSIPEHHLGEDRCRMSGILVLLFIVTRLVVGQERR